MSTGAGWEREVADYLRSHGYKTRTRYVVGSHEIDVYATRAGETLIVECKDWNQAVSKDPIRTVHNNAEEIGGTPGLAYTSELTAGAARLADKYGVVLFSAPVIRNEVLTLEDIEDIARAHSVSLPDVSSFSDLDNPIGPFSIGPTFAEKVAEQAQRDAFEVTGRQAEALERDLKRVVEKADASQCAPVLRNDKGRIDLYFIGSKGHDALPRPIEKKSLSFE
jgi:Holliday junction resolvase